MRAAAERRCKVAVADQFRIGRIAQIMNGEATVAPCGKAKVSRADEMMERGSLAERRRRRLAAGAVHPGQPPAPGQRRLGGVRHIDHRQGVIDEPFEMHRYIGVMAADPPDAMRAEAGHVEERDFARACRFRNVEDAQPSRERLFGLNRVYERLAVVVLLAGILLHRPDIRAIDREQNVAMDLQMV